MTAGWSSACSAAARVRACSSAPAGMARRLRDALSWRGSSSSSSPGGLCLDAAAAGTGGATCGAGSCMGACVAVHGWLQLVLGAVLPLAVMWAVEERSRLRFQQQWLQQHVVVGEEGQGGAAETPEAGGSTSGAHPQRSAAVTAKLPPPVPSLALAAWLAVCSWALWRIFEALLL